MLVPKLRFKEFTGEWNYFEIGKLFTNKSKSYNPNINNERLKCIELENINQESGTINGYISSISQKSNKSIFNINEVLFGKLRPYLKKYWYTDFNGVCSSEIWVLKTLNDEVLINHFIFCLIQSHYFLQLCNLSTGSKMPRADWNYICNQFIGIPKINEQEKIADMLSLLDKKIELQTKKIETLKLYNKSTKTKLFQDLK
ncbi:MAG: restriction endonuclease subunit S, partial [Clostridia bacterium]